MLKIQGQPAALQSLDMHACMLISSQHMPVLISSSSGQHVALAVGGSRLSLWCLCDRALVCVCMSVCEILHAYLCMLVLQL